MGRRLLVCAPLVSATLVGCMLRPSGKSNGGMPADASGPAADTVGTPDAVGMHDAIGMPDAAKPTDAAPADGTTMSDAGVACDTGYMPLACTCSGTTTNAGDSRTLTSPSSCTCLVSSAFSEAYVHLDGTSGAGLAVTFMLASSGGSDAVQNVVGSSVKFLNMASVSGELGSITATSMDLGLTVTSSGGNSVAGFYATVSSPSPTIGQLGWYLVGSASATPATPAMLVVSVGPDTGFHADNAGGSGDSVTISSVCVH